MIRRALKFKKNFSKEFFAICSIAKKNKDLFGRVANDPSNDKLLSILILNIKKDLEKYSLSIEDISSYTINNQDFILKKISSSSIFYKKHNLSSVLCFIKNTNNLSEKERDSILLALKSIMDEDINEV